MLDLWWFFVDCRYIWLTVLADAGLNLNNLFISIFILILLGVFPVLVPGLGTFLGIGHLANLNLDILEDISKGVVDMIKVSEQQLEGRMIIGSVFIVFKVGIPKHIMID